MQRAVQQTVVPFALIRSACTSCHCYRPGHDGHRLSPLLPPLPDPEVVHLKQGNRYSQHDNHNRDPEAHGSGTEHPVATATTAIIATRMPNVAAACSAHVAGSQPISTAAVCTRALHGSVSHASAGGQREYGGPPVAYRRYTLAFLQKVALKVPRRGCGPSPAAIFRGRGAASC